MSAKRQRQRSLNPYDLSELPPRGTGRATGTAKEPTGPEGRLTEEERRKRHKEKFPE